MIGLIHVHCFKLFVDATRHSSLVLNESATSFELGCFCRRVRFVYVHSAPEIIPSFNGVRVARSLVFYVVFCRSLFVLLSFFFWPLHVLCMSFFVRCMASYYLFGILVFSFFLSQVCTFDYWIVRVNKTNRHNLCVA